MLNKMRVVNVIQIQDGVVNDAQSFAIYDEQLSKVVVSQAESVFDACASRIGMPHEQLDDCLSDGYYENGNESVCIVWTDV